MHKRLWNDPVHGDNTRQWNWRCVKHVELVSLTPTGTNLTTVHDDLIYSCTRVFRY